MTDEAEPQRETKLQQLLLLLLTVSLACLLFLYFTRPHRLSNIAITTPSAATEISFRIDINTATAEELALLPRVGPVLANKIINHRAQHGPFKTNTALLNVSGIGPATLREITPHIQNLQTQTQAPTQPAAKSMEVK